MTEPLYEHPAHGIERLDEDRTMPVVVYVLYLLGFAGGITAFIGFVMAYALKGRASERMRSHYVFQIRTVWIGLAWPGCCWAGWWP